MFWNDLKFALRNLSRRKGYHLVNIGGLAVGMACALLIALWVADESSYDAFHPNADRLYRLNWDFDWNGNEGVGPGTPPPLARVLATEVPGIETSTRLFAMSDQVVRYGDQVFNESAVVAADSNFFEMFGFKLAIGDPATALIKANSIVLTQGMAVKYFGSDDPIGKTLLLGENQGRYRNNFVVTGVLAPLAGNTHIDADFITSMKSHPVVDSFDWSWVWMQMATYARLEPTADPVAVETNIQKAARSHIPASFERLGFSYSELESNEGKWDFVLQPIRAVYSEGYLTGNRVGPTGNGTYVYIFSTVAVFLVLIACINFMNLATAQAATRAKEIGIRKVLGSSHSGLIRQFLVESVTFSALAMPVALLLVEALLGPFNLLTGKSLEFGLLEPVWLPVALAGLVLVVGLLSGSYPSYYLSTFQAIKSLKGDSPKNNRRWTLRNALVVFQFAVTIALISCTFIVQKQIGFMRDADLGFEKENVLVISNQNGRLGLQAETFRDRLLSRGDIRDASITTGIPGFGTFDDYYTVEGRGDEKMLLSSYLVDEHFPPTMGLELSTGEGFSADFSSNSDKVLINEAAVAYFGWGDDAIGKTITYYEGMTFTVAGVLKDFHFMDLRTPVLPFALFHRSSESYNIVSSHVAVRIGGEQVEETIATIRDEWEKAAPGMPFEYRFLDETLDAQYHAEQRFGGVFLAFSLITVIVACIGLLGLVSFATEQRTKEIGVRKVLGASVPDIIGLLSKDFFRLVLVANLVAWPAAWFAMSRWLEDFAFRTSLDLWVFAVAGMLTVALAALTTGWRAVRAALANPVDSLRNE